MLGRVGKKKTLFIVALCPDCQGMGPVVHLRISETSAISLVHTYAEALYSIYLLFVAGKRRQEVLAIWVAGALFVIDLLLLISHLDGYVICICMYCLYSI